MDHNDIINKKNEILKDILIDEVDTLNDLEEFVVISKEYFKIEKENSQIVFNSEKNLSISQKILLYLISRYFLKQGNRIKSENVVIQDISSSLGILKTSLSKPLGILINENKIKRDNDGNYWIVHYQIKNILHELR